MPRNTHTEYALRRATDVRLRRKTDTTVADPTWQTDQIDPDTVLVTVGGTATDGEYIVNLTPEGGSALPVSTFRTAPETNTDVATGLAASAVTAIAAGGSWEPYIRAASSSGTVVSLIAKPDAPPFTLSETVPGGTIDFSPEDTYPNTRHLSPIRPAHLGFATEVEIFAVCVDSSGDPIATGTTTVDLTVLRAVERKLRSDTPQTERSVAVTRATTNTGLAMGSPIRLKFGGGRIGVHLSALTNPPVGVDAVEVWAREVVA